MSTPTTPTRRYSPKEVDEILQRALQRQHGTGAVSQDELREIAREVGIADDDLHAAATELDTHRSDALYRATARNGAIGRFVSGVVVFALVSVAVRSFAPALAVIAAYPWIKILFAVWAFTIAIELLRAVFPGWDARLLRERDERAARRAGERHAPAGQQSPAGQDLARNAEDFGVAVQRGVSTLLATLAREINARVAQAQSGSVTPRGEAPAQPPATAPSQVRVDANTPPAPGASAANAEPAPVARTERETRSGSSHLEPQRAGLP